MDISGSLKRKQQHMLVLLSLLAITLPFLPLSHQIVKEAYAVGPAQYWPWLGSARCNQDYHKQYPTFLAKGLDFGMEFHQQIYTSGPGTVHFTYTNAPPDTPDSTHNDGWGNEVIIKHANGYYTRYAHLSSVSVSVGDGVNVGVPIGRSGNSGDSTGPHLHYAVYQGGLTESNTVEPGPISGYNNPITCQFNANSIGLTYFTNNDFGLPSIGIGNLAGLVKSNTTGISNVEVTFTGGGTSIKAVTDSSGRYVFHGIPAGSSQVSATVSGVSKTINVSVAANASNWAADMVFDLSCQASTSSINKVRRSTSLHMLTSNNCSPNPTATPLPSADGIQIVSISSHEVSPGEQFIPSVTIQVTSGFLNTSAYLHATPESNTNTFGAWPTQGVTHVVNTGQTFTFDANTTSQFHMTAPQQTGTYQSVWRMHVGGQDIGPNIVIPITVRTVSQPHPIAYWDVDVYTSKDLSGSVAYHTTFPDQYIFRDWGIGSPASNVPVDNWSARLVREINFPGGDYHFHCQHDDGCRVLIDGTTKLDAWWDSSFDGHDWTGTLTAGLHEVKVEFYDQGGGAHIDMWWQGPGFLPRYPSCDPSQWCGDYWGNKTLSGFPPLTRHEGASDFLNVGWGTGSPGYNLPSDYFSARFTRTLPFACGTYRFHVTADDGDRFYIDGALKLDEWTYKGQYTTDVDVQISEGTHTLSIDYYENAGDTAMRLSWEQIMACAPYASDLVVNSGQTLFANTIATSVSASNSTATVGDSEGFDNGDTVFFHQTQGIANVGKWEKAVITSMNGNTWTLDHALTNAYDSVSGHAQAIKVLHYTSVTVQSGGTLTALPWNGTTGGVLVFESDGAVTVDGTVTMTGKGYRGGTTPSSSGREGQQGEGYLAPGSNVWDNRPANSNGGGGGSRTSQSSLTTGGGGGGGHATVGAGGWNMNGSGLFGLGGSAVGSADLSTIFFGGGGGQGGNANGYYGGNGGGAILIFGDQVMISGSLVSDGAHQGQNSVSNQDGNGGGGAGGSILIRANTLSIGTNKTMAIGDGGSGGTVGPSGSGSVGRIRIEYCNTLTGSTNPAASTAQICATATPTPTNTPTNTPLPTPTRTSTSVPTATPTSTPTTMPTYTPTTTPTPVPTSVMLLPVDDTYAESAQPVAVLGSDPYLNVDASPAEVSYLKFNLASLSGTVTSAKLRFYVVNASLDTQTIRETTTAWSENTLTWNNRPPLDSAIIATISTGGSAQVWKEVDITASVQTHAGGLYAIGIDTSGSDGLGFPSRENASNQVQLVVSSTGSAPLPTNTPTATPSNTPTATATATPTNTPAQAGNLALNKTVTSSSNEDSSLAPNFAVDGNTSSRWASQDGHDPEWIKVDLGASYSISRVKLNWEIAYGRSYKVQTSIDGSTWTTIYNTTTGDGGIDDLIVSGSGRYVRMYGTARGTGWGYSLWEFEIYGAGASSPTSTSTPIMAPSPTATRTATPTATKTPTSTPANTGGVELLTQPWHLEGEDGAAEEYQDIDSDVLRGKTMLRITYDLHGLDALGGDASAIIFDQDGWQYVSLSDYGENEKDGVQTVEIPLSDFTGLDLNAEVGTLHTRFWHHGVYVVDITSIVAH